MALHCAIASYGSLSRASMRRLCRINLPAHNGPCVRMDLLVGAGGDLCRLLGSSLFVSSLVVEAGALRKELGSAVIHP